MDLSQIPTIIGTIAGTVAIYEASGRGMRAAARKFGAYVTSVIIAELPKLAEQTLNHRYPLASEVNPRLTRIETAIAALPRRLAGAMQQT